MQLKHLFIRLFICLLVPAMYMSAQATNKVPVNLGLAGNYTIFVFGDLNQYNTDCLGAVAAAGDITLSNYQIASHLSSGELNDTLVAGGDISFTRGEVHNGNVVCNGSMSLNNVSIHNGSSRHGCPIDFVAEESELKKLSAVLTSLSPNGEILNNWGSLTFFGTDDEFNVFTITAGELQNAYALDLDVPEGAKVIINITGAASAVFQYKGIGEGFNANKQNVLFHFTQTSLTIQGIGVKGTILAPFADVTFNNGHVDGSVIAASLTGYGETHYYPFNSDEIPEEPVTPAMGTKRTIITLNGNGFGSDTGIVYFKFSYKKVIGDILEWTDTKIVISLAKRLYTGTYEVIVEDANGDIVDFDGEFTVMPIEFDIEDELVVEKGKEFTVMGKYFGPPGAGFIFVICDLNEEVIGSIKEAYGTLEFDNLTSVSSFTAVFPESVPAGEYLCRGFNYIYQEWNYYKLIVK